MNFPGHRTGVNGHSSVDVGVSNLNEGDKVLVRIDGILAHDSDFYAWSTPNTLPEHRMLSLTYTGTGP
ncbi:MAG: hypothetical protein ACI8TQ_003211 [Planctomycetota bacterium]|jgi:hypothetical protein